MSETCPTCGTHPTETRSDFAPRTITICPTCGAPAKTRCECDFAGVRVQRKIAEKDQRIAELERALAIEIWFVDSIVCGLQSLRIGDHSDCINTARATESGLKALEDIRREFNASHPA